MEARNKARRSSSNPNEGDTADLRRGPWTVDEDLILINHIANHGKGRWNSLARNAGLRRTGKSCRLRWLNYLRPDVRRGNITLEEQLLILELHSHWGNRWSKIAKHLPGRTDNEIKNYWRTRVQKHANKLKCDVGSCQFKDAMKYFWMPRLVERIQASATASSPLQPHHTATGTDPENSGMAASSSEYSNSNNNGYYPTPATDNSNSFGKEGLMNNHAGYHHHHRNFNYGMDQFQAVGDDDDDHQQQHCYHNNNQIQSCCWSGDGEKSSSDNLWSNVGEEDVDCYWY